MSRLGRAKRTIERRIHKGAELSESEILLSIASKSRAIEYKQISLSMNRTFSANAPALAELQDDHGGGNPQSAATVTTQLGGKGPTKSEIVEVVLECMSPNVKQLLLRDAPLRIALVIHDCSLNDHVVSAIRNPVSTCCIDSLTVLNPSTEEAEEKEGHIEAKEDRLRKDASEWLGRYHAHLDTIDILQGHLGFEEILRRESVDAVYIFVPANLQQTYVLGALQARKHVLLKDPVSTPVDDFLEQMRYAVQGRKRFRRQPKRFSSNR